MIAYTAPPDTNLLSPALGLAILGIGWAWIRTFSPPRGRGRAGFPPVPGAPSSPSVEAEVVSWGDLRPRELVATALNTADHPYDEMPLTELQTHLFDQHWEVWNLVGERNPSPAKWRAEHASDHGLVIR